jgi:hypothetical protein
MVRREFASFVVTAAIVASLSACAPPVARARDNDQRFASFPDDYYRDAAARGEPVFRVDAARSRLVIEVRRGGAFASAGHDHVIASHDLRGFIAPNSARADLYVELDRMTVDEPALRTEAGFDTPISEAAVEGTRANMLTRVLRADLHPFVMVSVTGAGYGQVDLSITLNGVTRRSRIPIDIQSRDDDFRASGALALDQTEFGITPLSLLGGAIQVQNRVDIRFSIDGHRVEPAMSH